MQTLLYKNTPIAYQDIGHGEVIVFLHGFLENQTMWIKTVTHFQKTHRCITIDLLGHGQTPSLGYIHTMEKQADVVLAVLKHLNIKQFSMIGHSMGGYIALAILEKKPKLVKKLVLLNSTAQADSEERQINRERAIAAVKQNHKVFISMAILNLFSENSQNLLTEAINQLKEEAMGMPKQGIVAALSGMKIRKDRTFLLEKYPEKFLIILGKNDPVLDYESTKSLANIEGVKIVSLAEGHMSWLENLDEMLVALKDFFK